MDYGEHGNVLLGCIQITRTSLVVEELLASRQGLRATDIELTNVFYLSSKWPFIFTHIHHSVTASAVSVSTAIKYN